MWRVPPMAVPGEADRPAMTEAVSLFFARAAMAGVTLRWRRTPAGPGPGSASTSRSASTPRRAWPMRGRRPWPAGGTPPRSWPGPRRPNRCCSRRRPNSIATCWSSTGLIMMRPLGWLLASGAVEDAQRLAAALYFFWYTRGLFVTGLPGDRGLRLVVPGSWPFGRAF